MKNNFRQKMYIIIGSLCISIMLIVSFAFCFWNFQTFDATIDNKTYLDDIVENYQMLNADFQAKKEEYTIYAFPSTLYLEDYQNYLNNPETNKAPEDLYGYVKGKMVNGEAQYTQVLEDKNGNVTPGDGGEFIVPSEQTVTNRTFKEGSYLARVRGLTADNTYVDDTNRETYYSEQYTTTTARFATYNEQWRNNSNWDYQIGDPKIDSKIDEVGYQVNQGGRSFFGLPINTPEEYGFRNLHRYNRFGFWKDFASGQGRYLPIKITIDENNTIDNFKDLIKNPFADMGDPNGYFNYVFSCWTYVQFPEDENGNKSDTNYKLPNFVDEMNNRLATNFQSVSRAAFCPSFVDNYFDVMQSLKQFADSNNVIRLFPKFSNGKGTQVGTSSSFAYGGADSVKLIPADIDKDNDGRVDSVFDTDSKTKPLEDREQYFTFSTNYVDNTYNGVGNIIVGIIPNFYISPKTGTQRFSAAFSVGDGNWNNNWPTFYNMTTDLFKDICDDLGEGIYNIYLFLGDANGGSERGNQTPSYNNQCFDNLLSDVFAGDPNNNLGLEKLNYLKGKNLVDISKFTETFPDGIVSQNANANDNIFDYNSPTNPMGTHILYYQSSYGAFTTGRYYRPWKIAIEKNNDVRLVPYISNDSENNKKQYRDSTFKFSLLGDSVDVINPDLDENNKIEVAYRYLAEGVNLADYLKEENDKLSVKFQMRFEEQYSSDLKFEINGIPRPEGVLHYEQLTLNGITYHAMSSFFESGTINVTGAGEQTYFSLNQEPGTYNILFIQSNDDSNTYYGYAYRYTSAFVKVFEKNPEGKIQVTEGDTILGEFVDETPTDDNQLLFYADYDVYDFAKGNQISANDICNNAECTNFNKTLSNILKEYLSGVQDLSNYCLRDHVSDLIIAWFDSEGNLKINPNFTVRKNYILYIDLINKV